MAIKGISPDSMFVKIAELPGAAAPGPHHIARVLDRCMKADRCLEWLEKASPLTPNLKKSLSFQRFLPLDPITFLGYWIGA